MSMESICNHRMTKNKKYWHSMQKQTEQLQTEVNIGMSNRAKLVVYHLSILVFMLLLIAGVLYVGIYIPIQTDKNEIEKVGIDKIDGTTTIRVVEKVKDLPMREVGRGSYQTVKEIHYYLSVEPMVFPWRVKVSNSKESLLEVSKDTYEKLKENTTYEIKYHKSINALDDSPVLREAKEIQK